VRSHWCPRCPKRSLVPSRRRPVLGQGGVDPILEAGALAGQHHAGAGEIPLIPQRAGRDPHGGERPGPWEPVQPPRVELIGLVHHAEHELRLARMDQLRDLAGRFDLVHDPVPGADGLDRHRRAALAGGQELLQGAAGVSDPALVPALAVLGLHRHLGIPLVGIEGDGLHGGAPPLCGDPTRTPPGSAAAYAAVLRRRSAFIASDWVTCPLKNWSRGRVATDPFDRPGCLANFLAHAQGRACVTLNLPLPRVSTFLQYPG